MLIINMEMSLEAFIIHNICVIVSHNNIIGVCVAFAPVHWKNCKSNVRGYRVCVAKYSERIQKYSKVAILLPPIGCNCGCLHQSMAELS